MMMKGDFLILMVVIGFVQPIEEYFQGQYTNSVSLFAYIILPSPENILAYDIFVVEQIKYNTNKTFKKQEEKYI